MKRFWANWWDVVAPLAMLVLLLIALVANAPGFPVYAASAAKYQEPGTCVKFSTVGSFDQYHCVDPTGNEYDTNTAGFMVYPGN